MSKFGCSTLLEVEVILGAISGDSLAMTSVLNHYHNYITSLSLRNNYAPNAKSPVYVDEFLFRRLETKLIEKVMTFDVNR